MANTNCLHQEVIPLALLIFGMVAGLLLAAWATFACWMIWRYRNRRRQNLLEQAALAALDVAPVEIDDDHMACVACWENRNPGAIWALRIRPLCSNHFEEPTGNVANLSTSLEDVDPVSEASWLGAQWLVHCSAYVQGLLQAHP